MPDTPAGPLFPVVFDEAAIAEDVAHHPPVARHALELLRRELDRDGGIPASRLKRCEAEGNDGTRLAGCLKTYVPWPTGQFGLVMVPVAHSSRPLALRAFAFGVRHPAALKPSVYKIADKRRNSSSA
ncbi:MAG TPA: hypothetical protein VN892_11530 [Solirubrobacteraceae bacterium]|nr:hypothetical protein [Solirubrobacteraceae bacterium]